MQIDIVQTVLKTLQSAHQADPQAMSGIVNRRVPCNKTLADHPTVVVLELEGGGYEVGFMGLLNAIVEELCVAAGQGRHRIAAETDGEGPVLGFMEYPSHLMDQIER